MAEKYEGIKFSTRFMGGKKDVGYRLIKEMINSGRLLKKNNLTPGTTGNISVQASGGLYIKAAGKSLGELTQKDIVYVSDYIQAENKALVWDNKKPSSETPTHWLIYRRFPKVKAVVHAHDRVLLDNTNLVEKNKIKTTKQKTSYGTLKQAEQVVEALSYSNYVFIIEHGSITVGSSIRKATDLMIKVHNKILKDES